MSSTILSVRGIRRSFGGLRALNGIDLDVQAGERLAVIGPNGAGKTTLFSIIGGELVPSAGQVLLDGRNVTGQPPYRLAERGLARTFQKNNLFQGLTVYENVRLAVQRHLRHSGNPFRAAADFHDVNERSAVVLEALDLASESQRPVRELSYGGQRQLELALALAADPVVLLLDEPTAGMSPAETEAMVRLLQDLPRELTLLIVEHDMDVVFALADRIAVLHYGELLAQGTPLEVRENSAVREAYLGGTE